MEARVLELESRLAKDSRNSGKPPSSDGLKRKPKSLRQPSGRKTGGQSGHPGKTLEFRDDPDERIVHAPSECRGCGGELSEAETILTERRQVFDLPPMKLLITEHQVESRQCPCCGRINRESFPEGVTQPAQYGIGVRSLLVYLQSYQLLPYARTRELMNDLFGVSISEGTLWEAITTGSSSLEATEAAIREAITQAKVAHPAYVSRIHFDETGLRIEGKLHRRHSQSGFRLYSASTETLVHYSSQKKRGRGEQSEGPVPGHGGSGDKLRGASPQGRSEGHILPRKIDLKRF
jgi:transposase